MNTNTMPARAAASGRETPVHRFSALTAISTPASASANATEKDDTRAAEPQEGAGEGHAAMDTRPPLAEFAAPVLPHAFSLTSTRPCAGASRAPMIVGGAKQR